MKEFDAIYETLLGNLLPEYTVPGVENLFREGSFCDGKYREVWDARERLHQRLGVTHEDPDVEIIISAMTDIQNRIAEAMFLLGKASRIP